MKSLQDKFTDIRYNRFKGRSWSTMKTAMVNSVFNKVSDETWVWLYVKPCYTLHQIVELSLIKINRG